MSFKRYFQLQNIQDLLGTVPADATLLGVLVTVDEDRLLIPVIQIEYTQGGSRHQTDSRFGCPYPPPCLATAQTEEEVQACIRQTHSQLNDLNAL